MHERKHKLIRRYATPITNTQTYEHSVLSEVTCHQFASLAAPGALRFEVGLINTRQANAKLRASMVAALDLEQGDHVVEVAGESRFHEFETCRKNDVVYVKDGDGFSVGKVWCHVAVNGVPISVIEVWELRGINRESQSVEWRQSADDPQLFPTDDIVAVAVWMPLGDHIVRTLLPSDLMLV